MFSVDQREKNVYKVILFHYLFCFVEQQNDTEKSYILFAYGGKNKNMAERLE